MTNNFGCGCGLKVGFGKNRFGPSWFTSFMGNSKSKKSKRNHRKRFGSFTGGAPHSLLNMQGPYGSASYGRKISRRKRRSFGAFTGGSPHSLLNMQGPYGSASYGRRRRSNKRSNKRRISRRRSNKRSNKRFGAFTGGSPSTLMQMQGPYASYSFGKKRKSKCPFCKKSMNLKHRCKKLGFGVTGEGYNAQTTYPNVSAFYFGKPEPWTNASGWFYPVTNGQVQSPQMLYNP